MFTPRSVKKSVLTRAVWLAAIQEGDLRLPVGADGILFNFTPLNEVKTRKH